MTAITLCKSGVGFNNFTEEDYLAFLLVWNPFYKSTSAFLDEEYDK